MQQQKKVPGRVTEHFHVKESDLNGYGLMHGGSMLTRCDETAFIAAYRHAGRDCLTRAIYRARFHHPLRLNDPYAIHAIVADTGKSSIWVQCSMEHADEVIMDAIFVFVAVDKEMQPVMVPGLFTGSDKERALQKQMRRLRENI